MKLPNQDYRVIRHSKPYASNSDKSYGQMTVTVFFKGSSDDKDYKTHIVKGMKNESQWSNVIGQLDTRPVVRFEPGRLSSPGIIDADSTPVIVGKSPATKPTPASIPAPTPDIFVDEPNLNALNEQEIKNLCAFILNVETYLANPELLEEARQVLARQATQGQV